jgi:hypothetical protein
MITRTSSLTFSLTSQTNMRLFTSFLAANSRKMSLSSGNRKQLYGQTLQLSLTHCRQFQQLVRHQSTHSHWLWERLRNIEHNYLQTLSTAYCSCMVRMMQSGRLNITLTLTFNEKLLLDSALWTFNFGHADSQYYGTTDVIVSYWML